MLWFHNFFMKQQQLEEKLLSAVLSVRNNLVPSEDISDKSTFTLLCGCRLNQYGDLIGECNPHREANFMNWTCSIAYVWCFLRIFWHEVQLHQRQRISDLWSSDDIWLELVEWHWLVVAVIDSLQLHNIAWKDLILLLLRCRDHDPDVLSVCNSYIITMG